MHKKINFIILGLNAYSDYPSRDMAGSMRVKNLFDPLLESDDYSISNLILLDLLLLNRNRDTTTIHEKVNCLSIGYASVLNPFSVIGFFRKGIKFIKEHKKTDAENILYNYEYPNIRNFLLLLYAKYKGFSVVFDFVEDKKHEKTITWNDRIRKKLSLVFFNIIPYYADLVFAISQHLVKNSKEITGNKIPVYLLPISVNFRFIDTYKEEKNHTEVVKIFYGGSFAPKDGLDFLLKAIQQLDKNKYRFKLILSGKGKPQDMEKFFSHISDKSLIDYRGYLSTEDYFKLLNEADICCMTRNSSAFANAGFPFKLGEFLAAGKIIIASRIGDVEKYLSHKESAYLVTPGNPDEIAAGLMYCIDNLQQLTGTMGKKAREVALEHFESRASSRFMLEKCKTILQNN